MGYSIIFSETNDPQQQTTHLCPHSKSPTLQSCSIIRNFQTIVYLPPDSSPSRSTRTPPGLLERIPFLFLHPRVLPEVVGVLVPGVVIEWIEGVMALRGTILHIQLRVKGLDATGMSNVLWSATVNLSWWGFLLYCTKNDLAVARVRVRAE
jgi:hypothetical protein